MFINSKLNIRRVQLKADIDELDVEAVFTVKVDLVPLAQSEKHRPGRHLVAPVVAVTPSGGVDIGLLCHLPVLEEVDEAAGVLRVVVGVEGDGDLVAGFSSRCRGQFIGVAGPYSLKP